MRMDHFKTRRALAAILILLVSACAGGDAVITHSSNGEVLMGMDLSTESSEARAQFLAGMDAADLANATDARDAFMAAVAADSTFALAHLQLANYGNSLAEYTTHLAHAEGLASTASEAEQLMISATRKSFSGDAQGRMADLKQLTDIAPQSSRAWVMLGGVLTSMNDIVGARSALSQALALEPTMTGAHIALANSYLYNEPKDFTLAEEHARHAVSNRPEEPTPYDILGDAHRAQGNLEAARSDYTMAAERAPNDASPIQQRGHVNSFMGDYAAARADYDRAVELGRDNERASFAMYRAFVSLHEGQPQAALDELMALTTRVDAMGVPEPTGVKINIVSSSLEIAFHNGMNDKATELVSQLKELLASQNTQANAEMFANANNAYAAYMEGRLMAAKGNLAGARTKAAEISTLLASMTNPRKLEPMHELMGYISLADNNASEAVAHLRQADQSSTLVRYKLAMALEGAGQTDEAKAIFTEVANNNFNSVWFAMLRADAKAKSMM